MAKLEYDAESGKVKDVSPGRSVYLSNKQWKSLNSFLKSLDLNDSEECSGALSKLLKISEEVINK